MNVNNVLKKINKQNNKREKLLEDLKSDCKNVTLFSDEEVDQYYDLLVKLDTKKENLCHYDLQKYLEIKNICMEFHREYIGQEYGTDHKEHVDIFLNSIINNEQEFLYEEDEEYDLQKHLKFVTRTIKEYCLIKGKVYIYYSW